MSRDVPCGACSLCCRSGLLVTLDPARDRLDLLDFELVVKCHKDDLDNRYYGYNLKIVERRCVHLVASKCSVYEHRPVVCKEFDCRDSQRWSKENPEIHKAAEERR